MSPTYKHAPTVCEEGGIWGKIKNLIIIQEPMGNGLLLVKGGFTLMIYLHSHPLGEMPSLFTFYKAESKAQ